MRQRAGSAFEFTLVELLVSVAIIMTLLALLLPSLNKARDYAKSISCVSNNKQILAGCVLYAADYGSYLPLSSGAALGGNEYPWWLQIVHSMGKNMSQLQFEPKLLNFLHCPANSSNYMTSSSQSAGPAASNVPSSRYWEMQTNYAYNLQCGAIIYNGLEWAWSYAPVMLSKIKISPSQAVILLDGKGIRQSGGGGAAGRITFVRGDDNWAGRFYYPYTNEQFAVEFRHGNRRINAGMADGHVEGIDINWKVPDNYMKWTELR
jgi:prepilin-type processing-associated H-X9-DG protein